MDFVLIGLLGISLAIIVFLALYYQSFSANARAASLQHAFQQLEEWRAKDLDGLRQQQLELARGEASVTLEQWKLRATQEAVQQLETWRANELQAMRIEQLTLARNQLLIEVEQWKADYEKGIRQDAISRSAGVTLGKITEHFIPYLPDFSYNPKDARFIGSPIDFRL